MRRGELFINTFGRSKANPHTDTEKAAAWDRLYGGMNVFQVRDKSKRLKELYEREEELFKDGRALTSDREFREANRADFKLLHSNLNYINPYWTGNWNLYEGDTTPSPTIPAPKEPLVPAPSPEAVETAGKSAINNLFSNLTTKRV